ncbi:MAG: glycosyltransferase family 4 protein [Hyphomicrobiaceae bacterium]|nr:glycosyltransferase family 4 protein [Hyphomicrobiaceae bacterium]
MHVTIVDSDVSWPATSGKRLRTLNLILPLAARHRLTYIGRSSGSAQDRDARIFLADQGITPILVEEPLAVSSGAAFYARVAANVLDTAPYSLRAHMTPLMRHAVQTHLATARADVCQLEWVGYLHTIAGARVPSVLQAHNVESLVWRRYAETERNPAKRAFMRNQWQKFLRHEGDAFRSVTRVVTVSEADRGLAWSLYGSNLPIDVVENGVDVVYYRSVAWQPRRHSILFVGALDWRPNQDAVDVLLSEILPATRRLVPDAQLVVVGRRPPPALVRRIAATDGAELASDVPDVRPYLASAGVVSVPLRIGGGSRLKILEALAAGVPVVSTTIGAEGLDLASGTHLLIADDVAAQARELAAVLTTPRRFSPQAAAGRLHVAGKYDWSSLAVELEKVWESAARARPAAAKAAS